MAAMCCTSLSSHGLTRTVLLWPTATLHQSKPQFVSSRLAFGSSAQSRQPPRSSPWPTFRTGSCPRAEETGSVSSQRMRTQDPHSWLIVGSIERGATSFRPAVAWHQAHSVFERGGDRSTPHRMPHRSLLKWLSHNRQLVPSTMELVVRLTNTTSSGNPRSCWRPS